eukprot:Awhi_evm1s14779
MPRETQGFILNDYSDQEHQVIRKNVDLSSCIYTARYASANLVNYNYKYRECEIISCATTPQETDASDSNWVMYQGDSY